MWWNKAAESFFLKENKRNERNVRNPFANELFKILLIEKNINK